MTGHIWKRIFDVRGNKTEVLGIDAVGQAVLQVVVIAGNPGSAGALSCQYSLRYRLVFHIAAGYSLRCVCVYRLSMHSEIKLPERS